MKTYQMKTKHTPAPWTVNEHSWSDSSVSSEHKTICQMSIYDEATEETQDELEAEMNANAKLIAAAPDLLESLQAIVSFIDKEGPASKEWQAITDWCDKGRAAITKATA